VLSRDKRLKNDGFRTGCLSGSTGSKWSKSWLVWATIRLQVSDHGRRWEMAPARAPSAVRRSGVQARDRIRQEGAIRVRLFQTSWDEVRKAEIRYSLREGQTLINSSVRKPGDRWRGNPRDGDVSRLYRP